jgi:hypothetical protein
VHINRQPPNSVETLPYTPVAATEQRRAMQVLNTYLFAPDVLAGAQPLFVRLQPQRRGFDFYGEPEDPKIHESLLRSQKSVLRHLLHPNTLQRLTDTQTYGGEYSVIEMLETLTKGVFAADLDGNVNSYRQNLQVEFVNMVLAAMNLEANGHNIRSALFAQLLKLGEALRSKIQGSDFAALSAATQAHSRYLDFILRKALTVDE